MVLVEWVGLVVFLLLVSLAGACFTERVNPFRLVHDVWLEHNDPQPKQLPLWPDR